MVTKQDIGRRVVVDWTLATWSEATLIALTCDGKMAKVRWWIIFSSWLPARSLSPVCEGK